MTAPMTIDAYIGRFQTALRGSPMAQEEQARLALEIRGHLSEVAERSDDLLERSMAAMGKPEAFAKGFLAEFELAQAVRFGTTRRVLIALVRVSVRSLAAFVTAMGAFIAYGMGVAFVAVAVLKPFFPRHTGLWLHPLKFGLEFGGPVHTDQELLGLWFIPVAVLLAAACFVVGTAVVRVGAPIVVGRAAKARG